jgi:hypothetical protein
MLRGSRLQPRHHHPMSTLILREVRPPIRSQLRRVLTAMHTAAACYGLRWRRIKYQFTIHRLNRLSQNGGTSCPSCRGLSTSVIPSRTLQSMVNVLLRADPPRIRALSERAQADEIYRPGQPLRVRNRFLHLTTSNLTGGLADPSAERAITGTNPASQYGLCATLSPLHSRESLWMEVRVPHRLLWRFRLTFVPAVQIPSQTRKQTKTKDGFWRTAPLPVTGSVGTGEPPLCGS